MEKVVHKTEAITLCDKFDFVLAVGIKGDIMTVVCTLRCKIKDFLLPFVTDNQLASRKSGRQHDDQRREHSVGLLGVFVGLEEATCYCEAIREEQRRGKEKENERERRKNERREARRAQGKG